MGVHTLADFIGQTAKQFAHSDAVIMQSAFYGKKYTYQDLYNYSGKIITLLKDKNVTPGDTILIWAPNSPDWVAMLFACFRSGIIAVPIDAQATPEFVQIVADQVDAKVVVTALPHAVLHRKSIYIGDVPSLTQSVKPATSNKGIQADDIAQIVFTSGTTSEPKGVMLSHKNILTNVHAITSVMPLDANETLVSFLPLSHMLEQTLGLLVPMHFGARIVYVYSRRASLLLRAAKKYKVTYIVGVPFVFESLQDKIESTLRKKNLYFLRSLWVPRFVRKRVLGPFRKLKYGIVGGAPLTAVVEDFWYSMNVPLLQGYGMTEASPVISCNIPGAHKLRTLGKPVPGQQVKLSKHGEVLVKGDNITSGYYKNPQETSKLFTTDGYLQTGDIGIIDEEQYLQLRGRLKTMILTSSGLNIYPEDIEAAAKNIPVVKDICVVELQAENGSLIAAAILAKEPFNSKKIQQQINEQLAPSQHVQLVLPWHAEDFPRLSSGKIRRKAVVDALRSNVTSSKPVITDDPLYVILQRLTTLTIANWQDHLLLQRDVGIDSLGRLELIAAIEDKFGVFLPEDTINNTTTIADVRVLLNNAAFKYKQPKLPLFLRSRLLESVRALFQAVVFIWFKGIVALHIIGLKQDTQSKEPCIYIMNHTSHLDGIALTYALRKHKKVAFAAAEDYFFKKGIFNTIKAVLFQCIIAVFPFARKGSIEPSIQRLGSVLERGYSVAIFPEGTRTTTGAMNTFKSGIGFITGHVSVPIVPVFVDGLFKILPKGAMWPTSGAANIVFGEPIILPASISIAERTALLERALTNLQP